MFTLGCFVGDFIRSNGNFGICSSATTTLFSIILTGARTITRLWSIHNLKVCWLLIGRWRPHQTCTFRRLLLLCVWESLLLICNDLANDARITIIGISLRLVHDPVRCLFQSRVRGVCVAVSDAAHEGVSDRVGWCHTI